MTISVIIVSYNTRELTLRTLDFLYDDLKSTSLVNEAEIFVVDNNSSDDSVKAIRNWFKKKPLKHTLITNKDNLGFARANNQAIAAAKGTFIFLLNSDTEIQPGTTKQLLQRFFDNPIQETTADLSSYDKVTDRLGMVAAQLYNPDDSIQPQGGDLPTLLALFNHFFFLDDIPILGSWLPSTQHTGMRSHLSLEKKATDLIKRGWVAGTAVMVRKELIDEIGDLDEHIFMYGEDVEWCFRAHHHHWDIAIDPQTKVIHLGSASSHSKRAIKGEISGYIHIWAKHKPLWQRPLLRAILKLSSGLRALIFGTMLQDADRAQPYLEIWQEL